MRYKNIVKGEFISRPNRFIANVKIDGEIYKCHVKNTGRCRELLVPGCEVWLEHCKSENRKTEYSLITVNKNGKLINMDSQAPNNAAEEWIKGGGLIPDIQLLKREQKWGDSRFDFYFETQNEKAYAEVKGVTLEENGVVMFPDAPTERGVKHVKELCRLKEEGFGAYLIFVIQMKDVKYFTPNIKTHKEFAEALCQAEKAGVSIVAADCFVTPDTMEIRDRVKVILRDESSAKGSVN